MKKIFLILLILSLISCKKENEKTFTVKFSSASEIRNSSNTITPIISCQINGEQVEVFNPVIGAPIYTCKSGDVLKFEETGWDWVTSTATLTPPYMIYETHQGWVESYIVVDNQVVQSYKGNGDSNLQYTIP